MRACDARVMMLVSTSAGLSAQRLPSLASFPSPFSFAQPIAHSVCPLARHTSVDIQVFAAGSKRHLFGGMLENELVGQRIFEAVGLGGSTLDPITQALNDCKVPVLPVES